MISAAPMPMTARAPMSWFTPPENAAAVDATPKIDEADGERTLAAEPVAEAPGR